MAVREDDADAGATVAYVLWPSISRAAAVTNVDNRETISHSSNVDSRRKRSKKILV